MNRFSEQCGEGTPFWMELPPHEAKLLEQFSKHFDSQPLGSTSSIPNTLHLIWLGPKPFPIQSLPQLISWRKHNPSWTIKLWTDRARTLPLDDIQIIDIESFEFSSLEEPFHQSTNWAEKSDILRLEILDQEGGVYADHDASCEQSFDVLNQSYDFYGCLETPHAPIDGRMLTVGIGVIGAKPKHPIIREAISQIDSRWKTVSDRFSTSDQLTQMEKVMHRTYIALTHAVDAKLGKRDVILPSIYFYPKGDQTPIYSKHHYATSWNFYSETTPAKFVHSKIKSTKKKQSEVEKLLLFCPFTSILLLYLLFRKRFR